MTFERDGLVGLGWDGHLLLLHRTEAERRARLASWVRRGLEHDEQVVYGQDGQVAPERSVDAVLSEHGIDVRAAASAGQFVVLPSAALLGAGPAGLAARVDGALAAGFRGMRLSGQAVTARTGALEQAYPWLAAGLGELCRTRPMSALCQYTRDVTVGTRLEEAAAAHVDGVRELQLQTGPADGGLVVAGEVDDSNELLLLATVRAATVQAAAGPAASPSTPDARFRLDMRRVTFLSAGGSRALAVGSQRFRERGGRVVLAAPEGIVARILQLIELDALMNIEIVESLS